MELVDTHAHLDHPQFADDLDEVLERAEKAGVVQIVTIGTTVETSERAVALAERYPQVYATVGIHPHDAASADEDAFARMKAWASHPKVVAIGEIGLDFYYDHSPRPVQLDVFRRQLELAREVGLPIVIHSRDAAESRAAYDLIRDVLTEAVQGAPGAPPLAGVLLHSYTGPADMAAYFVEELGCYVSTGGIVTFKNAGGVRDVFQQVPLDRVMVETDAPYLSPEPLRGRRNEPARVRIVAEYLARLRGVDPAELARITTANAGRFFRLPDV